MRERSTWDRNKIKKAAEKPGDIYTMNQDHPQPAFDEYVIGGPSEFAEDVHSPNTWESEYSGEEVKRNEIGMPEMRGDTFNHSEKTASKEVLLKKANLCVEVATMMLAGKRVASESMIEDQAFSLMFLPAQELINTHTRLAQQQEGDEEEVEEVQEQEKQAGEVPEAFKENIEKMKAKSEEKSEDGEKKQAGEMPEFIKEKIEEKKEEDGEKKEAAQDAPKDVPNEGGDQNAKADKNWPTKEAAQDMMAQMQQMMAQLQQMMQQGQQMPQAPMMADQGMDDLDQMLAQDSCGPMAESDIQMDAPGMDMMASDEDEILRSLFANEDEQVEEVEQVQQKQAKAVRTASTRTVGTRPSEGVAKLGGGIAKQAGTSDVDQLSSLWSSAPDVSSVFK